MLRRANTVPGDKSYAAAVTSRGGLRIKDINQQVKNSFAKFKVFPGCNSWITLSQR